MDASTTNAKESELCYRYAQKMGYDTARTISLDDYSAKLTFKGGTWTVFLQYRHTMNEWRLCGEVNILKR